MTSMRRPAFWGLRLALVILTGSCAKSDSAVSPSPQPTTGTTVTITSSGATPRNILLPRGSQATFLNRDSVPHDMYSDPHPEHTDCPEFNQVGYLVPGQRRQTGNLITVRVCGYHDHDDGLSSKWQGNITIQ